MDPDGPHPTSGTPRPDRIPAREPNAHTGLTPFTGTLTDEAVEIFRQATSALAGPDPGDDGSDPGHRRTGSPKHTIEVLRAFLDAGPDPPSAGTSRTSR